MKDSLSGGETTRWIVEVVRGKIVAGEILHQGRTGQDGQTEVIMIRTLTGMLAEEVHHRILGIVETRGDGNEAVLEVEIVIDEIYCGISWPGVVHTGLVKQ